jgi:hypothetical protein
MKRDVLIGTLTGISAVIAMTWLSPRGSAPAPVVVAWPAGELARVETSTPGERGLRYLPSTRPDPTLKKLETPIGQIGLHGRRLDKLIADLAAATGANIVVNWHTLAAEGVGPDAPVTLELQNVPARVVLMEALRSVSKTRATELDYQVVDRIVRVSTADDLGHFTSLRVYDVRDILALIAEWDTGVRPLPPGADRGDAMDALVKLIQETVSPTTWRDAGGTVGAIRAMAGRLIVTGTPQMHEEIVNLLEAIRRTGGKPAARPGSRPVTRPLGANRHG